MDDSGCHVCRSSEAKKQARRKQGNKRRKNARKLARTRNRHSRRKKAKRNKLAQKDTDARWTKKNKQNYYGYKSHNAVDAKSKLIKNYDVTDASVHDSNRCGELLDETDKKLGHI